MKIDGLTIEQWLARRALALAAGGHPFTERRDFMDRNGITRTARSADNNRALVLFAPEALGWKDAA